ncbi:MAG: TonB-dependent receptor [Phenylobacterium sp.]|nr:TonB-dependent receptor [Phenylobacterium sp.]
MKSNHMSATSRLRAVLLSTSTLAFAALALVTPASAQQKSGADEISEVVVTGSRVVTDGTRAPTPVTVVSSQQLQMAAPRTITDGLLQLPIFKGSPSVQNQGTGTTGSNGAAYLNLRGLGTQRTLVLLDGRRVVPASSAGSVDVALLPEALVQRVDVVTGGASAAYGSDAVAGVVNFILNTKFVGLKGEVQGGISNHTDDSNYKGSLTWGGSFLEDRLHVVASGEHYYSDGVKYAQGRDFTQYALGAISNPNVTAANPASPSNPKQLVVTQPYSSIAALGGLITNTSLRGTTFGPGGVAQPFQYGQFVSSTQMQGGGGYNPGLLLTLQPKQQRDAVFGHVTYDVSDNLTVFAETNVARNKISYNSLPTFELSATAFNIFADNAYLPASVRAQMAAGGINSVVVGRISPDIAIPHMNGVSDTQTFTAGFDGKLGASWSYHGYAQTGRNHANYKTSDDPISDNLYRAADAVVNPANGQIVCRTTLTDPNNGCVPLNIFGDGSPSAASRAYIVGTAVQDVKVRQDVAEFSIQGELFKLPAGPVSAAAGVGYRKEQFTQTTDSRSTQIRTGAGIPGYPSGLVNTLGGFERTNPQPTAGSYDVKEAFAEAQVPLLTDAPMAKSLTLNGAVRYTDYSTSGGVTSWKVGAVYQPFDGLTLRATRSRDIRAPNLGELYQGSSQGTSTVIDPRNGGAATNALTGAVGNPALTPELSDTTVIGFVAAPTFAPGLSVSVDYYDINIADAISALTAQQEINLCQAGATEICGFIERNAANTITRVRLPFFNVAQRLTKGVDAEASYTVPLSNFSDSWDGTLSFRALVNHLMEFTTQVQGAPPLKLAGDIGNNSTPHWSGVFTASLDVGRARMFVQERWIGDGRFDNTLSPTDISRNHVPAVFYTDATVTYDFTADKRLVGFFTVNNLFDKDPPATPGFLIAGSSFGNRTLYDLVGRMYTIGLRFRM